MNRLRSLFVVLFVAAGAVIAPLAAAAHDDKGTITVTSAQQSGSSIRYEVAITYDNDGHHADDPTATVVAEKGGVTVGPVALEAMASGTRFTATLTFPSGGAWTVRFSSLEPAATLEILVVVAIAPVTTTRPPTTVAPTTIAPTTAAVATTAVPTTIAASTTTSPSSTVDPTTTPPTTTVASDDGGGGAGAAFLVAGGAVVLAGAAAMVLRARRRTGT